MLAVSCTIFLFLFINRKWAKDLSGNASFPVLDYYRPSYQIKEALGLSELYIIYLGYNISPLFFLVINVEKSHSKYKYTHYWET